MSDRSPITKQVTAILTDEAYEALREMADVQNVSLQEALGRALASQRLLAREIANGSKVLIEKPDRSLREVVVG